ncbi:MAG TPA: transcription elongation factor GreA [Bacillota bacterium]|nr:transcription elongation factor GreA [Bacillota bacterium]HQC35868.1 transcription elongation factor GreA [Bacillota bacterium]
MSEEILLTQEGYDKLVQEHEYLVLVKRKEVSEQLKEAKSYGDLAENAEYDAAKDEQAEVEDRINKLEFMMRNAKIISEEELTGEHVNLGLGVRVRDMGRKKEYTFTIVGTTDADPFQDKISNESPVGKALLGKAVGDVVEIHTEDGDLRYKVIEIIR